jgi:hypothetical protein
MKKATFPPIGEQAAEIDISSSSQQPETKAYVEQPG